VRVAQQPLFLLPVEDRLLDDASRTVLEAIDCHGPISAREAGEIVFRLQGYRTVLFTPKPWLTSSGRRVLRGLERKHMVRRGRGNRWTRRA
jgi:hypothetical protein